MKHDDPDNPLHRLELPPLERGHFTDDEAVAASGLAVPSLRALQASGALRAINAPKFHGGFRRMWPAVDVYKAAVAAGMAEHFGWNLKIIGVVLARLPDSLWRGVEATAQRMAPTDHHLRPENTWMTSGRADWFFDLINRRLLFLVVPKIVMPMLGTESPIIPLGVLLGDAFRTVPWLPDAPDKRRQAQETVAEEFAERAAAMIEKLRRGNDHAVSRTSLNISMLVRAAQRRSSGLPTDFILDSIQADLPENDEGSSP